MLTSLQNHLKTEIIYCALFRSFPDLVFGFSTKKGGASSGHFEMNLSSSVGDDPEKVKHNRKLFFEELGIKEEEVTFQKQIHSTNINYSDKSGHFNDSDALYTDKKNVFLSVSVADCIPVFLFDPVKQIVAGVHSGWKGSSGKILTKTIKELQDKFNTEPSDLIVYIGPGISGENYEVGDDVAKFFDDRFKIRKGKKYLLDLKKDNFDQLIRSGVREENIEVSELCTFKEKDLLHSFRRDGNNSGRMFGIIGMKG